MSTAASLVHTHGSFAPQQQQQVHAQQGTTAGANPVAGMAIQAALPGATHAAGATIVSPAPHPADISQYHQGMIRTQDQARQFFRQKQMLQQQQQQQLLQQAQQNIVQQQLKQPGASAQGSPNPNTIIQRHDMSFHTAMPVDTRQVTGHGIYRLMQVMDQLSPSQQLATDKTYWHNLMHDTFAMSCLIKWSLCNIDTKEQKSYYLSHGSMATFLYTLYQCGLVSLQFCFEQTVESVVGGLLDVDCAKANFIFRYEDGSLTMASGTLFCRWAWMDGVAKIQYLTFICQQHDHFVAYSALGKKKTAPPSFVNAWGLPERVYHMLQLLDIATDLEDVMAYASVYGLSGRDSLQSLAAQIDAQQPSLPKPSSPPKKASPKLPKASGSPAAKKRKLPAKRQNRRKSLKGAANKEHVEQDATPQPTNDATHHPAAPVTATATAAAATAAAAVAAAAVASSSSAPINSHAPSYTSTSNMMMRPPHAVPPQDDFFKQMTPMATPTPFAIPSQMINMAETHTMIPNGSFFPNAFADLDDFMMTSATPASTK
ncbi:LIM-domain binding protein-domain-containing protein [Gongronella butleri]|nr:LIM-domain binding protein-domain-containing protein [Gongronella butleri]